MRLLSNLLKQRQIISDGKGARLMNYDQLIAEKLEVFAKDLISEKDGEDFVSGLSIETVEVGPDAETLRNNALEEAEQTLLAAKVEAQQLLDEAIVENQRTKEVATKEGFEVGYNAGFQQGMQEVQVKEEALIQRQEQLELHYEQQKKNLEPELVDAILDVFKKVFDVKFNEQQDILIHLIKCAIQNINSSKEFIIKVSQKDFDFVLAQKEMLEAQAKTASVFEILLDHSLERQQCIIETDAGLFDCSVDVELDQLIKSIKMLSI